MILSGEVIAEEQRKGNIILSPFDPGSVTSNSYDLRLGPTLLRYTEEVLDPKKENRYELLDIASEGHLLQQGELHLGHSIEIVGSEKYVPIIHARSSIARLGLFVHITADLIDIGSVGNITFQLYSTLPIKVYPGLTIGQVSFWKPYGKIKLYAGKYQSSKGPIPSRSFQDRL